jgi:phospholipase/lecithinase/hemolysin
MRKTSFALALLTAAVLTACGGNGPRSGDQTPKTKFSNQITFGDSLSDVGTYAVGSVKAMGGGQYTINGNNTSVSPELTGENYTTLVALQLGLSAPCAAQTGLLGTDTTASTDPKVAKADFNEPVVDHPECFNYAQGGARVTNPVGPGNALLDHPLAPVKLGQLTVPVTTQIDNHLKKVGKFKGDELVIVMAGGNDALEQLGEFSKGATDAAGAALGGSLMAQLVPGTTVAGASDAILAAIQAEGKKYGSTPTTIIQAAIGTAAQYGNTGAVANAATIGANAGAAAQAAAGTYQANPANSQKVLDAMTQAGKDLADLVKTKIIANGANYVVVNNLPDVSISPSAKAQSADTQKLIAGMVANFNGALKAGIGSEPKVLYVDLATVSHDQATNPAPYGLTNTTTPACIINDTTKNPLSSSLVCNKNNLISGDVSHYMFADSVHPTPFEYALIARYVLEQMAVKGWL